LVQQVPFPVKRLPQRIFIAERDGRCDPLAVAAALPRGTGIILRDYAAPDRAAFARVLAAVARRCGLVLLVAGDAALARSVGANGLHLPGWRLFGRPPVRRAGWIVSAAAHNRSDLRRAATLGVDAALLSPAFATASHQHAPELGPHRFARLMADARLPVYALGGIDRRTQRQLPPGTAGVAAISAFADQKFRRVPR